MKLFLALTLSAVLGVSFGAFNSRSSYNEVVDAMFASDYCRKFLMSSSEAPVDRASKCGGRRCAWPREICFEDFFGSFSGSSRKSSFQCKRAPQQCWQDANGETVTETEATRIPTTTTLARTRQTSAGPSLEVCTLPKYDGRKCYAAKREKDSSFRLRAARRWFFHAKTGVCKRMTVYACGTPNRNNFKTRSACKKSCGSSPIVVTTPAPTGNAVCSIKFRTVQGKWCPNIKKRRYLRRFSFDASKKTCRRIRFKGCGGNANVFKNIKACRSSCAKK